MEKIVKEFIYPGKELDIFHFAVNWKNYWASRISPYLRGRVLEVGAGIGNNTILLQSLCRDKLNEWTCLEPDPIFAGKLKQKIDFNNLSVKNNVVNGTLKKFINKSVYDTIIYIDVLEHIEDDFSEIQKASALLSKNGHLIVLSPAHPFLYTEFDRHIGHYRRYTISSLRDLNPKNCKTIISTYMDSAGMAASFANRLLMRQSVPSIGQIMFWDKFLVRISYFLDILTAGKIGKSVLYIWEKS